MVFAAFSTGTGCRKPAPPAESSSTSAAAPTKSGEPVHAKTLGVSLLTAQHQFYQDLRAGLESAAKERNFRLLIVSAEFDPARQANQIDEFIVQKVNAVVVSPCDSKSIGAAIAAANQAGIPVFTADIASTSPLGKVVSHVASDNVAGGRQAAGLLAKALGDRGTVAILSHPEVASVSDRVRGFREGIAAHPGLVVVAELSAGGRRDRAASVMEDILQSHPDLSGVFAINDDTALGALAAVESAGRAGRIHIVGYDATPEARAKIAAGALYGDVIQYPRRIGEMTIYAVQEFFEGRAPPAVIPVDVGVWTRESADAPAP